MLYKSWKNKFSELNIRSLYKFNVKKRLKNAKNFYFQMLFSVNKMLSQCGGVWKVKGRRV